MTRNVDQLRSIQTFEELIPFLEDDLDWPFPRGSQEYEFDDLTFEYTPDELGLEDEYAAKIKRIHQLRPLVSGQPWGIFFVEFENKKLPIVVLRRILSHLVLKQRKSANPADRARWNAGDLLFISAFAEEGTLQREIAFAHFHQDPGDQPTLRVLGWDGGDTPLKLEHVSQILRHRLSWPRNAADHAAWRKQWAGTFRYSIGQQIQTADMLARELARVARNIRDAAMALMKVESSRGPLRRMHEAFRIALIHDLTQEGFADTYAQTITYGLLTAAISRTDRSAGADGTFVLAEDLHNMVPITNPFLKEMLESFLKVGGRSASKQPGLDFDELGVQEVVEMLRSSELDLPAVLEDFGNRNPGEDPVIRFYEDFLKAYNRELKVKRGVFYTPQSVVSYIVRSVHKLLQVEFELVDGLASTITWGDMASQMAAANKPFAIPVGVTPGSHFVVILDPATGTATFLVEVIEVIFRTLTQKWKSEGLTAPQQLEAWNRYVPAHLLPRLFGYELMMAPYAIAHMKIGLKLHETGYAFGSEERVRVYLTNALEPIQDFSSRFAFDIPALAHEAEAVNSVKKSQRFTVVIGNPPYSGVSANTSAYASEIVEPYKFIEGISLGERKIWAKDDYKKFCRLGQMLITASGRGILGYITNHGFISEPTSRGMRYSLLKTFERISIIDLHGSLKKREIGPGGEPDINVFDIEPGVSISLMRHGTNLVRLSNHVDLWGDRSSKYERLSSSEITSIEFVEVNPQADLFLLSPRNETGQDQYRGFIGVDQIFLAGTNGIQTSRDHIVYGLALEDVKDVILNFRSSEDELSTDAIRTMYWPGKKVASYLPGDTRGWSVQAARETLRADDAFEEAFTEALYRPFDLRTIFYADYMIDWPRKQIMSELVDRNNIALCVGRAGSAASNDEWNVVFVADSLVDMNLFTRGGGVVFPLRITRQNRLALDVDDINLDGSFAESLLKLTGKNIHEDSTAKMAFDYIYAILYSPEYRKRFAEFLKFEFPRIPLPGDSSLFEELCEQGAKLVEEHLLRKQISTLSTYVCPAGVDPTVEKVSYANEAIWIDSAQSVGFEDVPISVWKFHVGGHRVCEKWLKDRKGRLLSPAELTLYSRILMSISNTIETMADIDRVIEDHGGWSSAFA